MPTPRPLPPEPAPLDWQDPAIVRQVQAALRARPFRKDGPGPITRVQTHISSVFLTPRYVFKFKRPVDVGFVDMRRLRQRLRLCREELRLNRRLAPDVYLGVVALRLWQGRFSLGARGTVVDYAVLMKRLPAADMLDARLRRGRIRPQDLDAVAEVIARFHAGLRPDRRQARFGGPGTWLLNWEENFQQTGPMRGVLLSPAGHAALRGQVLDFLRSQRAALHARVQAGRVRNGHGDLRCEHIALRPRVRIIDCVEFSERFRIADVGNDLAFLLMDLCAFGYPGLAQRVLRRYVQRTGDRALPRLLAFYACYRATVRAKVLGMRLRDRNLSPAARKEVIARGRAFFALAQAFARQMGPPALLVVCGLMGSGKSRLAATLAARTGMRVLSSDAIRKELSGRARDRAPFGAGIYSARWTERTYAEMVRRAQDLLASGHSVILDATFSRRRQRQQARLLGKRAGATVWIVECVASEALTLARLRARERSGTSLSDGRAELFPRQKSAYEPITAKERGLHMVLRTQRPVRTLAAQVLATPGLRIPEPLFTLPPGVQAKG